MLSSVFFNDALPVPMLRQVFLDLSEVRFPHVFIALFTKSAEK